MSDVTWHGHSVSRDDRIEMLGARNRVLWFTGLSGSGKSTIASLVAEKLHSQSYLTYVLDGDNVRHGLNSDLGFSDENRSENIRRVAEVAKLMYDAGITVIVSFISPFRKDREFARKLIGEDFIEVFVDCPLKVCEERDPKGLYAKARKGEIEDFTGISSEYEEPENAEIVVETEDNGVGECVERVFSYVSEKLY